MNRCPCLAIPTVCPDRQANGPQLCTTRSGDGNFTLCMNASKLIFESEILMAFVTKGHIPERHRAFTRHLRHALSPTTTAPLAEFPHEVKPSRR